MHRILNGLLVALVATTVAWPGNATAQKADAREVYYQRADPGLNENDAWLGIRTSVLLASSDRRRPGLRVREVSDRDSFRSGDRFRLSVQANVEGYLYIFVRDGEGDITLLFPYERGEKTNTVKPFRTRQVPEEDWFRFDEETGAERIYLFLSRRPIRELERAAGEDDRFRERELESLLEDAGDNEWMLFDEPGSDDEVLRTYYAEMPETRNSYLVRVFELEHR